MSATQVRPVEVRLKLDRTPKVPPSYLRDALFRFNELAGDIEAFQEWLMERFPDDQDRRVALWARARAFGLWQNSDSTLESDRLMRESLELEAALGLEVDPPEALHHEAIARLGAAAKHPLDSSGHFADGFAQSVEAARRALVSTPAGVSVN